MFFRLQGTKCKKITIYTRLFFENWKVSTLDGRGWKAVSVTEKSPAE
ncbi:hypothetical protein BACCAP_01189 [Pseudoflavonifractor capillosus ATCC 29799]|uniref:Uncharacterized protein n=1 Tax=Pseudoflavonifractor capillosus ATCC 29799 TaxID=411467 RepID=A6NSL0_9FIRM|nr:hypothetical protein BACCAP_01189 [Pseudoflavonifractor capillosus ATCC 29799]